MRTGEGTVLNIFSLKTVEDDFSSHEPPRAWPESFEFEKIFDATCMLEGLACHGV